jgi:major type 1 subunit fimbrin (pilin)
MNAMSAIYLEKQVMKVIRWAARACVRKVLFSAMAMLIAPVSAWATASCHSLPPLLYTLNFPASVAVARDLPNGSPLTGWVSTTSTSNYWTCDQSDKWYTGTDFEAAGIIPSAPTAYSRSYNGVAFPVYATNVPGVGMALGGFIYSGGQTFGPLEFPHLGYQWNQNGSAINNGGQLIGSLVKIGDITPGVVSGQIAQAFSWESATKQTPVGNLYPAAGVIDFNMTPVIITVLTCQTPDVTVDMGTHSSTEFPGVGAPSARSTTFNLSFNNCPAGIADSVDHTNLSGLIHSVQYRIDPISPDRLVASFSNVVALDTGAQQAGGIGIQLYDSTGAVFPLSTFRPLTGFNGTLASSYSVSMRASYFRTGVISPGTGNATMLMTVNYP